MGKTHALQRYTQQNWSVTNIHVRSKLGFITTIHTPIPPTWAKEYIKEVLSDLGLAHTLILTVPSSNSPSNPGWGCWAGLREGMIFEIPGDSGRSSEILFMVMPTMASAILVLRFVPTDDFLCPWQSCRAAVWACCNLPARLHKQRRTGFTKLRRNSLVTSPDSTIVQRTSFVFGSRVGVIPRNCMNVRETWSFGQNVGPW